jgi:uncharacterized YigZ family protein
LQVTSYYTVKGGGQREIVIQKSRFIAHVDRATTEEQAQEFIRGIKKKYWDATHNCSAYIIGRDNGVQKANDDGEPGGTAGMPILEVLRKKELKDTVAVVTRYFVGIKLGAAGLIRAYGKSAAEAVEAAGIVECRLMRIMLLTLDYTWLGKIENEIGSSPYILKETKYLEKVEMAVYVTAGDENRFCEWIMNLTNGQADIKQCGLEYLEVPV